MTETEKTKQLNGNLIMTIITKFKLYFINKKQKKLDCIE